MAGTLRQLPALREKGEAGKGLLGVGRDVAKFGLDAAAAGIVVNRALDPAEPHDRLAKHRIEINLDAQPVVRA